MMPANKQQLAYVQRMLRDSRTTSPETRFARRRDFLGDLRPADAANDDVLENELDMLSDEPNIEESLRGVFLGALGGAANGDTAWNQQSLLVMACDPSHASAMRSALQICRWKYPTLRQCHQSWFASLDAAVVGGARKDPSRHVTVLNFRWGRWSKTLVLLFVISKLSQLLLGDLFKPSAPESPRRAIHSRK